MRKVISIPENAPRCGWRGELGGPECKRAGTVALVYEDDPAQEHMAHRCDEHAPLTAQALEQD